MAASKPSEFPRQHQDRQPGYEHEMKPAPETIYPGYRGSGKLEGRRALITGGDSGIGRAVAVMYAREGADVAIAYLDEEEDAEETRRLVEEEGRQCLLLRGDVQEKAFCEEAVERTVETLGGLNVLVNGAAVQYVQERVEDISEEQFDQTFRTNIYAHFFMAQAALWRRPLYGAGRAPAPERGRLDHQHHVDHGLRGQPRAFGLLLDEGCHPGLHAGAGAELGRGRHSRQRRGAGADLDAAHPGELPGRQGRGVRARHADGPRYVFLASQDSSYITGQTLHPNGGQAVGG